MHQFLHTSQTDGSLRSRRDIRLFISYLETCHLTTIWKLYFIPHRAKHIIVNDEGEYSSMQNRKERSELFLNMTGNFAAIPKLIYIWRYYLNWKRCWFLKNEVISILEKRNSYFIFSAWYFLQFRVSYRILKNKKQKNVSESALKPHTSVFGVDNDNTFGAVVVVSRCRTHKQN